MALHSAPLSAIIAVADDGSIGDGKKMPWHLPDDFKWFKEKTLGHAMIMGRRTFESIGRPLPGRTNIVLTRDRLWSAEGVRAAQNLEEAMALVAELNDPEPFVIGGAEIYKLTAPLTGRIYWTEVHKEYNSPLRFSLLDRAIWREVYRNNQEADHRHEAALSFTILERIKS